MGLPEGTGMLSINKYVSPEEITSNLIRLSEETWSCCLCSFQECELSRTMGIDLKDTPPVLFEHKLYC